MAFLKPVVEFVTGQATRFYVFRKGGEVAKDFTNKLGDGLGIAGDRLFDLMKPVIQDTGDKVRTYTVLIFVSGSSFVVSTMARLPEQVGNCQTPLGQLSCAAASVASIAASTFCCFTLLVLGYKMYKDFIPPAPQQVVLTRQAVVSDLFIPPTEPINSQKGVPTRETDDSTTESMTSQEGAPIKETMVLDLSVPTTRPTTSQEGVAKADNANSPPEDREIECIPKSLFKIFEALKRCLRFRIQHNTEGAKEKQS